MSVTLYSIAVSHRPLIESRPAGELAMRIVPGFGRALPVELPADWVPRAG